MSNREKLAAQNQERRARRDRTLIVALNEQEFARVERLVESEGFATKSELVRYVLLKYDDERRVAHKVHELIGGDDDG